MVSSTALAVLTAVIAVRFAPQYSLHSSYLLTSAAYILATWATSFFYKSVLYPAYLTPLKNVPTPPNRSLFSGNTDVGMMRFPIDLARHWAKTIPNDGMIRFYGVGNNERLLLLSPKAISDLLVSKIYDFERPEFGRVQLETVTGDGLLTAEGDVHKAQRKSLMPSFSYRHVKDLYPTFWLKALQMTNEIEKGVKRKNGQDTITIRNWSSRAMLDIIGLAGMNSDFNSVKDPDNEISRQYENMGGDRGEIGGIQLIVAFVCLFFIGFKWFFNFPTKENRATLGAVEYIRQLSHRYVDEKRAYVHRQEEQGKVEDKKAAVDILSVAMRSGTFTDRNLVDQMMTFLAAGHDTTSSAFQWAIYALSKHPEMQTRLQKEIRDTLPPIALDDLDDIKNVENFKDKFSDLFTTVDNNNNHSCPYLWAIASEVLRFYPSVPVTSRQSIRDTTLAGQYIPKGTLVFVAPDVTNRDTDLWGEDAETFNPERWLNTDSSGVTTYNNNGGAKNNYAFLTFVHGPRSCIGQGFARAELAIFLAAFVYQFEFELSDPEKELVVTRQITQAPADGVVVKLRTVE